MLKELGFEGAIGLQCYGVKDPPPQHLRRSIEAWRKNLAAVK
jgi:hypothetical protein